LICFFSSGILMEKSSDKVEPYLWLDHRGPPSSIIIAILNFVTSFLQ
jgi:hypothetical protein